jgi:hypothetical protein
MRYWFLLLLACIPSVPSDASPRLGPPSTGEHQLDFWIGDWTLHSRQRVAPDRDEWREEMAVNHVRAILDGKVIQEEFDGRQLAKPLLGMSLSVYHAPTKKWKQTWVDNQGSYLDFVGEYRDGKMIFTRDAQVQGRAIKQRMCFENITPDRFTWKWERSSDDGKPWLLLWELQYQRQLGGGKR